MATIFPLSPAINDTFSSNGVIWVWNGEAWIKSSEDLPNIDSLIKISASATTVSVSDTNVQIDSFPFATYSTAEYTVQLKQGTGYKTSKVLVVTDGTNVKYTEYAILNAGTTITSSISASISGSNVVLYANVANATSANATARVYRIAVNS